MNGNGRIRRLQNWLVTLAIVVVFLGVLAPATVLVFLESEADRTQLEVACHSLENQRVTIAGINQLRAELGIPHPIPLPEVPAECRDT